MSFHLIHAELALVLGAVLPDQDAKAVFDFSTVDKAP